MDSRWEKLKEWEKSWDRGPAIEAMEKWIRRIDPAYRIEWGVSDHPYSWDGLGTLRVGVVALNPLLAVHDVLHLYVSPRKRHVLPEFGLGPDPYHNSKAPLLIPAKLAWKEEIQVCNLHWAVGAYFGGLPGADFVASEVNCEERGPYATSDRGLERFAAYFGIPDFPEVVKRVRSEHRFRNQPWRALRSPRAASEASAAP